MSSIVLGTVGQAVGSTFGPVGGAVGGVIGSTLGGFIDSKLFAPKTERSSRFLDVAIQSSAYGKMIPLVYGQNRIAGNIIWSQPITETSVSSSASAGGGKGGGAGKVDQSSYRYSVTLAISICEGEIDDIIRVWADAKAINPNEGVFRLYKGSEEQLPDSFIESIEGIGKVPAYRGQAYVVIEDFPLGDYGNRIPNFTFEVKRRYLSGHSDDVPLEDRIQSMTLIPGAGEYVYDDAVQQKVPGQLIGSAWVQQGNRVRINQNNRDGKADGLVALDQLASTCKNVEWVSVVVTWFGNSIDAGDCTILPGVEFSSGAVISPDNWAVGSYTRSTARAITLDGSGSPIYGGTPNDASLLRYIQEIKLRGYNVMFYPMFFMDVEDKPWRGRVTGTTSEVADFFTRTHGYNAFISHYANLVKDDVDAFVIGSELVGLTTVRNTGDNSFPGVNALVSLAATVKGIVGSGVKVTYAADWSEYHHTTGGWYHLDPLWASSHIDMVGIDAYFPLTDAPQTGYDTEALVAGWTSGEGYDWVYTDDTRTTTMAISPQYAWKNIAWWWQHNHVNPDAATTAWTPESKPIWFTEYGYPSVDGASNQPNVFYDPSSSESAFPRFSKGRVDFRAQRAALIAAQDQWEDSAMVERMFVWTWDARPFPFWPDMATIWADGGQWRTGHWVQGKLGISSLGAVVSDICQRVGLSEDRVDVTRLSALVDGMVINQQVSARQAIDLLRQSYFFDAAESAGVIKYVPRGGMSTQSISTEYLMNRSNAKVNDLLGITRQQELELPRKVDVVYSNLEADYQVGSQHSVRQTISSQGVETLNLPVVMGSQSAKSIADVFLYNRWLERTSYEFALPIRYALLEPTDIVSVTLDSATHTIRIVETEFGNPGMVRIKGVAEDIAIYDFYNEPGVVTPLTTDIPQPGDTVLAILDIPALPSDNDVQGTIRLAATGYEAAWKGAVVFRSDDDGAHYNQLSTMNDAAVIGTATTALGAGVVGIFDQANSVTVTLYGDGELESRTSLAILNGANTAVLGDEVIQFTTATLVEPGKYTLSGLLRGQLGTELAVSTHSAGEVFVLIDNRLVKEPMPNAVIGLERLYKPVSVGASLADTASQSFTYRAVALIPYAPVHSAGVRDGSGNLTISWIRRTRINGQWLDYADVPLGEESEAYEVDIMNGSTVVRTLSGLASPSASYSAAEQVSDFGAAQSSVTIRIYQLSALLGRGRKGEAVV